MESTNKVNKNMDSFERLLDKVSELPNNQRETVCVFVQGLLAANGNVHFECATKH